MSLVIPADVKPLVPTPLSDNDLQIVIDRVEADLTNVLGAAPDGLTAVTESLSGGCADVFIKRKVLSVTSVTEYQQLTDTTGTALTNGTEYFLWSNQGRLQRLGSVLWGERVDIVYVPVNNAEKWEAAIIDLIRIYLSETALASETITGSHSYNAPDNWDAEIRRVTKRLQFTVV